mgnify:CR=1 FL=1
MNDFLKINEIIDLLKVNEKNEINQFKKQLEQQLSHNESNNESNETLNKVSIQSDNKNTYTISDKESVSEHFETIENNLSNENNSIETTEEISEKISEETKEEISEKISEESKEKISEKTISTNTQTDFDTNEIQNNEIQNNEIQNNEIQNNEIQNNEIQNNEIQNNEIQNNEIQNNEIKIDIGFVLFCFDHRFINNMHELLRRDQTIKSFNYFSLAGGSLGFLKNELGCWDKTCIDHIELAQKIYNIKKIIIIDHEDCEMYKDYYKDLKKHPKREKKHHINNLTELMEIFEKQFQLTVDAFILNLDGSFIKI